ncbi:unnamed protein product [Diabrotica balteata]|uniref:Uncharacterized protein n=1 Tax=Diabrotica balteata TaxID=107213 RepID=A0A9N9T059_DIABA|nr:unnamed protein product [Diabrotica balteata]
MEEIRHDQPPQKLNPIERTNVISRLFFCWLIPYFAKGYKRDLTEDDMYKHRSEHDSGSLGAKLERRWNKHIQNNKNPAYWKVLMGTFFCEIFLLNILAFTTEGIRMSQPFLISKLLKVYEEIPTEESMNDIYLYAGLIIVTSFLNVILVHRFNLAVMQIGMKMRIASCSLIYRKSLKLSKSALAETTIGQMVNLLSNDVGRFDQATHHLHHFYLAPIQTTIVMVLLYLVVGWTALLGTVFLLLSIPLQSWLGKKTSQFRLKTATRTDERVRLMNEIISGIQVIKMYTWEYSFAKLVEYVRKMEMKYIRKTSVIRGLLMSMTTVLNKGAVAISIITYVISGNTLTASYAYTVASYYRLLGSITMWFPQAVSQGSEMFISMKRIQSFLLFDELKADKHFEPGKELEDDKKRYNSITEKVLQTSNGSIHIKKASAKWLKSQPDNNLENINMDVTAGEVVAVVGSVGSGKSTLLHIIMKELELQSGSVDITGTVSYASQEPWLFGGSIRQNILFGEQFDQEKYDEVVKVCALQRDFTLFPHGDRTLAGERGVTLSGGQRARINLARAVYKEADIYLLDDPLSAVDTHVGKHLFEECICGYLSNKCVVLVTHQLQHLKNIDKIYLMTNGKIAVSGSYSDIRESNTEYSKLLADMEEEEEESRRKSQRVVTKSEKTEKEAAIQVLKREGTGSGNISDHVYMSYARAGGNLIKVFLLISLFFLGQGLDSLSDYFITFWVNIQQWNSTKVIINSTDPDAEIYHSFENWWLTPLFTSKNTVYFYTILVGSVVIIVNIRSLSFYLWCIAASTKMHNKMFMNIVYSPMRFFNTNPSGRILNRFSKDIGSVDEVLPTTLLDTVQIALSVAAITAVIGSLTYWILIPTVAIAVFFYFLRVIFLETSRDVKRVESVKQYGGNMGLALTQTLGLTGMFQWGMRQWSELENQMTSVERVQEYADLKQEDDEHSIEPPKTWPHAGEIQFDNMSLYYTPDDPPVLKNLSFTINPSEKIGIVGRTGAGKSSLIQALFRLTHIEGRILVDDIDTKKISLKMLRSKISIIPQEPVLFSGTLRNNLDPFDEYTDEALWNALEEVELKQAVDELPAGLANKMAEGGTNFSVGQRQLVCLARAIVGNNKILVLDEATANVDPYTDALIQKTIRKKFANCTVLTIAHRLNTIMDSDKVLVMDAGKAVEFDHPFTLLKNINGVFYSLVMQTGKTTAKHLIAIAEQSKTIRDNNTVF